METQNWLLKQASTQPDKVAVTDGASTLTFRQVKDQVEQIVGCLNQLHPGPRWNIADNSIESYKTALAIL